MKKRKIISLAISYLILLLMSIFFLFPLVFMFVSSLKNSETQIISDMSGLRAFIPYGNIGFKNYLDVFSEMNFFRFLGNSCLITALTVCAGILVNSMIAYSLARHSFRGKKLVLLLILALIIIPRESIVIPLLLIVAKLGWRDSYHVQILPFIADPLFIFLFYQFFISVPKALDESALVDGAGPYRIYWSIILPLSYPVIATVAILHGLFRWGDLLWPLMVTIKEAFRPLPVAMQQFFSQDPKEWGNIFAFSSLVTIPLLVLFLLFQKWFVKSVASSGIKG